MGNLLLERSAQMTKPPLLPKEYQQVEYIESTGTQWIDTLVIPTNHETDVVFQYTGTDSRARAGTAILGHRRSVSGSSGYYQICIYQRMYYWGTNGSQEHGGTYSRERLEIKYNHGEDHQVIVNGNILGSGKDISISGEYTLCLLKRTISNLVGYGRIYSCQIIDKNNNALVRNYVPCYRISDNTAGLYDLITGNLYENSGSGQFIVGPPV